MRSPIKAAVVAATAFPLAFVLAGTASADEQAPLCVTPEAHQQWVAKAEEHYPAEQIKHQNNLAAQQGVVAQAQSALQGVQQQLGTAEQKVRELNAAKNAALADIKKRHGYIAAFQAKYAVAEADYQRALDLIGKAKSDYRTAKNAGDQAGMDAAHAAAEQARAARADAEGRKAHYGPASQQVQRDHIARQQAIVDQATADGGPAYQEVLRLRAAVTAAQQALGAEQAKLPALETKVADIARYLQTAVENAAKPVCDDENPAEDETEEPTPEAPASGDEGSVEEVVLTSTSGELSVERVSGELPVQRISGSLDEPDRTEAAGVQSLASTGANDRLTELGLAGLVLLGAGTTAVAATRRGRHAR